MEQDNIGPRAKRLLKLLDKSLQVSLKSISLEKMSQCFPTLASKAPEKLKSAHSQVINYMQTHCQQEFDKILAERDLINKMNQLDLVIKDAQISAQDEQAEKQLVASTLNPQQRVDAHIYEAKIHLVQNLESRVAKQQSVNDKITKDLTNMLSDIEHSYEQSQRYLCDIAKIKETAQTSEYESIHEQLKSTLNLIN